MFLERKNIKNKIGERNFFLTFVFLYSALAFSLCLKCIFNTFQIVLYLFAEYCLVTSLNWIYLKDFAVKAAKFWSSDEHIGTYAKFHVNS